MPVYKEASQARAIIRGSGKTRNIDFILVDVVIQQEDPSAQHSRPGSMTAMVTQVEIMSKGALLHFSSQFASPHGGKCRLEEAQTERVNKRLNKDRYSQPPPTLYQLFLPGIQKQ